MRFALPLLSVCALTLAGTCSGLLYAGEEEVRESSAELSPIDLLSCADGGQEDRPRPSCQSPRPKAVPALGIHPQRAYLGGSEALLKILWSNGGWNKF
ncbi:MAG: hypothetical protein II836_09395, partial [Clostridia bacterium]|nr:hypothetical protein [Clostridia bacterium]